MTIFLIILAVVFGYTFIGSALFTRHHMIESRKCGYDGNHFGYNWCSHTYQSLWLFGVAWPAAIPVKGGQLLGGMDKAKRDEKRRSREIEEAKHQAELAKYKRIEDEELNRQLAAIDQRKSA